MLDLAVIGAGPCGLAVGVAAKRARLTCSLFDQGPVASSLMRSEEHTSELQSRSDIVCRLLLVKKKSTLSGALPPPVAASKDVKLKFVVEERAARDAREIVGASWTLRSRLRTSAEFV